MRAGQIVDRLMPEFENFVAERKIGGDSEKATLQKIKIFLHRNEVLVQSACLDSRFDQSNCLTLSTLACLMAARKGIQVSLGKPKNISERFVHTCLIKSDGKKFHVVNYDVESTEFIKMDVDEIIRRFIRNHLLIKAGAGIRRKLDPLYHNDRS